jgi:tetratricopeptide (TPR) repeat protein
LSSSAEPAQVSPGPVFRDPVLVGGAGGFALVWGSQTWVGEIGPGSYQFVALPVLLLIYLVLVWCLDRSLASRRIPVACFASAGVGLLIHLLGAGGIEMPAVAQLLLVLPVVALVGCSTAVNSLSRSQRILSLIAGVACIAAFYACLRSATLPVLQRKSLMSRTDLHSFDQAEAIYREASVCDPLSPEPLERLADVEFGRWYSSDATDPSRFAKAIEFQQTAIGLNPYSAWGYQKLGRWYQTKYARAHDVEDAQKSAEFLELAMSRYPNSAPLVAELAMAYGSANNMADARRTAERALELDKINHDRGHRDRYLPGETIEKLTKMTQ